jgi:hypothetical protein
MEGHVGPQRIFPNRSSQGALPRCLIWVLCFFLFWRPWAQKTVRYQCEILAHHLARCRCRSQRGTQQPLRLTGCCAPINRPSPSRTKGPGSHTLCCTSPYDPSPVFRDLRDQTGTDPGNSSTGSPGSVRGSPAVVPGSGSWDRLSTEDFEGSSVDPYFSLQGVFE